MFIQSCSSLKNHSQFQSKMGRVYSRFQTKTVQKPFPMGGGGHIPVAYIREYPPPPHRAVSGVVLVINFDNS